MSDNQYRYMPLAAYQRFALDDTYNEHDDSALARSLLFDNHLTDALFISSNKPQTLKSIILSLLK